MNVTVKNTFLQVEDESILDAAARNQRRNKTMPMQWKQSLPASSVCSEASTAYSPRSSIASSLEDASVVAAAVSSHVACCPCTPSNIDLNTDALTEVLNSLLTACLPGENVKIEKITVEHSRRVLVSVEPQNSDVDLSRCYKIMQGAKQSLCGFVSRSEDLSLLSARLQREDYGYSLRSSVVCIPDDKQNQMCWDVLQKGSCRRRKCCHWYHPQAEDIVKFKVVIRSRGPKAKVA
jgi:hypothetical protein